MESKIKSAISFQKNKLKEIYSVQRAGFEELIDPKSIDRKMDNLEKDLIDMVKLSYQPSDNPWKRIRNILFKIQFVDNWYDDPLIQIVYTMACKWKIMINIKKSHWMNLNNDQIVDRVKKISSEINLDMTTVNIYEQNSIKWIEIYAKDQPLYEFYVVLLAKLILLLADANIDV